MGDDQQNRTRSGSRIVAGALLGTVPGLLLMGLTLVIVEGEAQLSLGVLAIMITTGGAVVGAILGAQRDMRGPPMALGALVGSVPGLVAFLGPTRLALPVLVVGALAGGLVGGALARREP